MKDRKSKGHIGFLGDAEYFEFNENVYRAPRSTTIDINTGVRTGARWEARKGQSWDMRRKILKF